MDIPDGWRRVGVYMDDYSHVAICREGRSVGRVDCRCVHGGGLRVCDKVVRPHGMALENWPRRFRRRWLGVDGRAASPVHRLLDVEREDSPG